ncbi:hypothetical protein [Bartonella sp. DGB1]|uniref:hypothetical protein n=1 Tax=Bartonella sp. DGB1 TaxID=3239807 RepID=UPI0035246093
MKFKSILRALSVFVVFVFSNIQVQAKDTEKKYEITSECITENEVKVCRIKALRDIGDYIKKGDLGGFIQSENNLSHKGDSWVADAAIVYGSGAIFDDAKVFGNAKIYGEATILDYAAIFDNAEIYGGAIISGNAKVFGNAKVDSAEVYGNALVYDNAHISDYAIILDDVEVFNNAKIHDGPILMQMAMVCGNAEISGNVLINGNLQVAGDNKIFGYIDASNIKRATNISGRR